MEDKKPKLSPRKRKWLVRTLIIILLFLAFLIGRSYQQGYLEEKLRTFSPNGTNSNDSHITWKTYTDTKNKFFLQYPSDWSVTGSAKDFVISKNGSNKTNITLFYPNNPKANIQTPPSSITQPINVGKDKVTFNDYFTGLGNPTSAYAQVRTLPIGTHIAAIGITLDVNNTQTNAQTVKKILGSLRKSN